MKKLIFCMFATMLTLSCADMLDEQEMDMPIKDGRKFSISVANSKTRALLNDSLDVRWTRGDMFSVFESAQNIPYYFMGKTGDDEGMIWPGAEEDESLEKLSTCYAVFPYRDSTSISADGVITYNMPAVQTYAENSFGQEDNTMVGVSHSIDDEEILFFNTCGIIKVQLYGNTAVYNITLRGNNNELIAGPATIQAVYGEEPIVTMNENASKTITINCGEEGVELSRDSENPTNFYFVVPPVTFTHGFTITINGTQMKSVDKSITVEQDIIQPMATFGYFYDNYDYRYTTHNGNKIDFNRSDLPVIEQKKIGDWWVVNAGRPAPLNSFRGYEELKDLVIPGSIDFVGNLKVFEKAYNIESIEIAPGPNPIKWHYIDYGVGTATFHPFYYCEAKKYIFNREIILYDKYKNTSTDFSFSSDDYKSKIEEVVINYPMKEMPYNFFKDLDNMGKVTLPSTLTKIKGSAFENTGIKFISITNGITDIESMVFRDCSQLKTLVLEDGPEPLSIKVSMLGLFSHSGPFYDSPLETVHIGRELIYDCNNALDSWSEGILGISNHTSLKKVTIGKYVKTLSTCFFANNQALPAITIPGNVTSIGNDAFYNCIALKDLVFEKSTENEALDLAIDTYSFPDEGLFAWCKSLSNLTLARNLTYPEKYPPFKSDWKITIDNITIKDGCSVLGKKLFYDNLESNCTITCEVSTPPSIEDNTFNWNNINGVTLRVPKGSINDYKNSPWGKFKNIKEY